MVAIAVNPRDPEQAMSRLVVRNRAQQALFVIELAGQLSDGHWENATPHDHWKSWCRCDVEVAAPGEQVGRDFWPRRDRYAFDSKDLLDVVGPRMLRYARVALRFDLATATEYQECANLDGTLSTTLDPKETDPYWVEKHARTLRLLRHFPNIVDVAEGKVVESVPFGVTPNKVYSMTDMRRDLRDLGRIVKVRMIGDRATEMERLISSMD